MKILYITLECQSQNEVSKQSIEFQNYWWRSPFFRKHRKRDCVSCCFTHVCTKPFSKNEASFIYRIVFIAFHYYSISWLTFICHKYSLGLKDKLVLKGQRSPSYAYGREKSGTPGGNLMNLTCKGDGSSLGWYWYLSMDTIFVLNDQIYIILCFIIIFQYNFNTYSFMWNSYFRVGD